MLIQKKKFKLAEKKQKLTVKSRKKTVKMTFGVWSFVLGGCSGEKPASSICIAEIINESF
jgi:hypothetical protein